MLPPGSPHSWQSLQTKVKNMLIPPQNASECEMNSEAFWDQLVYQWLSLLTPILVYTKSVNSDNLTFIQMYYSNHNTVVRQRQPHQS